MDDRQFAEKAKQLFDESVDGIDAATLSRLNRGRQEAIAELDRSRSLGRWLRWAPAAGVAAAAIMVVMIMQGPAPGSIDSPQTTAADFEILLDEGDIEMFEDLEFFALMDGLEDGGNVG
ncbi:MAG: hypothetical protein QNJ07_06755 [Woeseiaceae bacterium]|nr:hypothetical protein [Woeseiaceae bacterium]